MFESLSSCCIHQVVAVLLDNFIRAVSAEKSKAYELEEQARMMAMGVSKADSANPMDPLLDALSRYKSEVYWPCSPTQKSTESWL